MKVCSSCNESKDISKFQKRSASNDGLTSRCKKCLKKYDDSRLRDPKRMKARRDYQKTEKGKAAHRLASKKWVEANTIKRAANIIVCNAVRSGRLIKGCCEVCGSKDSHGHHDDYSKPMCVRWLCAMHHNEWHKENGEGINAS